MSRRPRTSQPTDVDPLEDDELLTEVLRALVDEPGKVHVEETRKPDVSYMLVHVAPDDRGKIIGREGKTMNAIRIVFGRIAAVEGRKTFIHVVGASARPDHGPPRPDHGPE